MQLYNLSNYPKKILIKLNNLITLDNNELFKIYSDVRGIHIAGDTYDIVIDDTQTDISRRS